MSESVSPLAHEAIVEIIENQIREQNPPETKQTYERLTTAGHSHEETMKLIGSALSSEIYEMLQKQQPFDPDRYAAALDALPRVP